MKLNWHDRKLHSLVHVILAVIIIVTCLHGQVPIFPYSCSLSISSEDRFADYRPGRSNLLITLTNTSGRSLHVLQPGAGGLLENLQFMVLVEGEDTAFVNVNPDLAASLRAGKSVQLKPLQANESLTCTVDLFSGAYGVTLPPGKGFEVQAIYMSVYKTGNPNVEARAAVWPRQHIYSNVLTWP